MIVRFKKLWGNSKDVPKDKQGRTEYIGRMKANVYLGDDGLVLTITNKSLAERIQKALTVIEEEVKP